MRSVSHSSRGSKASTEHRPEQLSLELIVPAKPATRPNGAGYNAQPAVGRIAPMDQRMTTNDVLRVVGVNRSTIFRWTKAGRFPQKHESGGWLRSEVERWLAGKRKAAVRQAK